MGGWGDVLILVRHGRTVANASGLLLGRLDPPLDEVGERQAEAIAARLGPTLGPTTRVLSSPLVRAQATAAALGRAVEVDHRWVELDYGDFDGRKADEVGAEVWDQWRADPAFVPAGGESLAAVGTRVAEACEELAEEAREGDVVVVSHVSPIKAALAWALGVGQATSWRTHLDPASITRVAMTGRGPLLHAFNDVCHLS